MSILRYSLILLSSAALTFFAIILSSFAFFALAILFSLASFLANFFCFFSVAFASFSNFSFTSSVYLPIFKDQPGAQYLDKRSVFWETKFFYDKTFADNKWQIFTEADFGFNFGQTSKEATENGDNVNISERFANNSMFLPVSAFLSYFPTNKSTIFVNAQQAFLIDLGNNFEQNYTQLGFGGKYQITDVLNLEASYGKIVRGVNFQGLGNTYSLGIRALF